MPREHDKRWAKSEIIEGDKDVYGNLKGLPRDPRDWDPPAPDPKYAAKYRNWAQFYFGLRYDYLTAQENAWDNYYESPGL